VSRSVSLSSEGSWGGFPAPVTSGFQRASGFIAVLVSFFSDFIGRSRIGLSSECLGWVLPPQVRFA
jgi:hypothetical protein